MGRYSKKKKLNQQVYDILTEKFRKGFGRSRHEDKSWAWIIYIFMLKTHIKLIGGNVSIISITAKVTIHVKHWKNARNI